jgi:hypothetical protein
MASDILTEEEALKNEQIWLKGQTDIQVETALSYLEAARQSLASLSTQISVKSTDDKEKV